MEERREYGFLSFYEGKFGYPTMIELFSRKPGYHFEMVEGIGVLGAEHLIPFKMYAWINLLDRKNAGEHVNERDLKKHKYDVFRLLQIVTAGIRVESEGLVAESIHRYIAEISAVDESELRIQQMGMPFDKDKGVELLKDIYM